MHEQMKSIFMIQIKVLLSYYRDCISLEKRLIWNGMIERYFKCGNHYQALTQASPSKKQLHKLPFNGTEEGAGLFPLWHSIGKSRPGSSCSLQHHVRNVHRAFSVPCQIPCCKSGQHLSTDCGCGTMSCTFRVVFVSSTWFLRLILLLGGWCLPFFCCCCQPRSPNFLPGALLTLCSVDLTRIALCQQ